MMNVVMHDINPVLLRTTSTCRRQFKKDLLDVVTVVRVGLGATYPVSVALATMLLVATHEELYCTVLADLVAVGRPPVPTVAPLLAAACHVFELDGLGVVEDVTPPGSVCAPDMSGAAVIREDADDATIQLTTDGPTFRQGWSEG